MPTLNFLLHLQQKFEVWWACFTTGISVGRVSSSLRFREVWHELTGDP